MAKDRSAKKSPGRRKASRIRAAAACAMQKTPSKTRSPRKTALNKRRPPGYGRPLHIIRAFKAVKAFM